MLPPLPSVIAAISAGASAARLHDNCLFGCGFVLPAQQQRDRNSIGTWQRLLVPPGKRLMRSQTFLGFPCHLGEQRLRSAPRHSWQEQSLDPKLRDAPVPESSWVCSVCEPGTGLSACTRVPVGEKNKTEQKPGLQHHSTGTIYLAVCENRWISAL